MNTENNPFQAPEAHVADVIDGGGGTFILEGQALPAGNGFNWLTSGWDLFTRNPGVWIGLTVIYMLIIMVMGIIPFIGGLAVNLLSPVFIGGIMLGCKALDDGDSLTVNHLFSGFSNNAGNLVIVGLIYLVGVVAVMLVVFGIGAVAGLGLAATGSKAVALIPVVIAGLIAFALMIPLAMAVWFAPALVIFHQVPPFEAMKASFFACIKNFLPFLLYGLAVLVLAVAATIPLLLGWLVLIPVMMATMYAGYKDMFLRS